MTAQPLVQIQPSTLDVAATGVHLVALDDIGHTATVEALIGQDGQMIAPLLPYAVLAVNGSSRKLRAVTVRWTWSHTVRPTTPGRGRATAPALGQNSKTYVF